MKSAKVVAERTAGGAVEQAGNWPLRERVHLVSAEFATWCDPRARKMIGDYIRTCETTHVAQDTEDRGVSSM